MDQEINRSNVGRIAERLAANELEARGFRVSDLNRDGLSANADLVAAGHGAIKQIQVKGSTNGPNDKRWWWQYGYCTDAVIDRHETMFNRKSSFYRADIVILIAVRSTTEYECIVLPEEEAEEAAQINLERGYRTLTLKDAQKKKPGKVWITLDPAPREDRRTSESREQLEQERAILARHKNNWDVLLKGR